MRGGPLARVDILMPLPMGAAVPTLHMELDGVLDAPTTQQQLYDLAVAPHVKDHGHGHCDAKATSQVALHRGLVKAWTATP